MLVLKTDETKLIIQAVNCKYLASESYSVSNLFSIFYSLGIHARKPEFLSRRRIILILSIILEF